MPRQRPDPRHPEPGLRVSLRRVRADQEVGDLVGFVLGTDAESVRLRDRRGVVHVVAWADVRAWRMVGVARGRDPLRTPRAELDRMAAAAGVEGRVFVARLSDLLDGRPPAGFEDGAEPPCPAVQDGEWVSAGNSADYLALAWWSAHRDARNLQVRTSEPAAVRALLGLGFTELP